MIVEILFEVAWKSTVVAGCVVAMLMAAPLRSWADGPRAGFWLATSTYGSGDNGNQWGRLMIKNGLLSYHGAVREWQTPLADIKRVSPVKGSNHLFEIERTTLDLVAKRVFELAKTR